jgi:fibro-slime domain-containing protein
MSKRFSILGQKGVLERFLPALLLAVGAFSGTAEAACLGVMKFKPPSDWSSIYVAMDNQTKLVTGTADADGYYTIDLGTSAPDQGWGSSAVLLAGSPGACGANVPIVTATGFGVSGEVCNVATRGISCPASSKDTIYVENDPLNPGTTYVGSEPNGASYLYVLVPDDKDWQSDAMMISANGGAGVAMKPATNMCGWFMMAYKDAPDEVIIYRKNKPDDQIGQTGLWGNEAEPTPLPLKAILDAFGTKAMYFIPDDSQWPEGMEDQQGLFVTDPMVDGICSFELAAVIYDSDESDNPLFSSDPNTAGYGACTGVRNGIVMEDLGPDNKPQFNSGNANATTCAGTAGEFNSLFNYVQGKNEVQCYNMPFRHYGTDSRWGFDSDSTKYTLAGDNCDEKAPDYNATACAGATIYHGGFYPLEKKTSADRVMSLSPEACPRCHTPRKADAPVPVKYAGDVDKYCNTKGWFGGVDCDRLTAPLNSFYDGDHPANFWDWGTREDWSGVTRNQQYCFESHATFTYSEDQEFTFRGDDDIWVFINKKIAVDNGGAHLAAPGHVVLKNLNTTYGEGFLVPGQEYQLDIFFCDRRTTMTNVIIKTNMFIRQTSGLNANGSKNADGSVDYNVCYDQSGDGSCASVALGQAGGGDGTIHACGADIATYGNLKYRITTRAGVEVAALESGKSGWQYGGIDLSNQFSPKVNTDKINGLAPGSYRLVIDFCDASGACNEKARTYINFRIKGNLDVMTQTSTYVVNAGDEKSPVYANNTKWEFVGEGLAGSRVPVYVSAFADGGVDLLSAVGQKYTLVLDKGMKAYTSKMGGEDITGISRTIGESGIDTIWVYQGLDGMTTNPEEKVVSLKSQAKIKFYAPRLDFAEPAVIDSAGHVTSWTHPIAGDPDTLDGDEYYHWIGSDVDLYVLIVNPINNEICTECQMTLTMVDASSGVTMPGDAIYLGDGAYVISIRSRKEYMDTTAYITISSAEDAKGLSLSSYVNLRFREPPVPYPQLVDLFDVRGESLGSLSIPEPYYSESKEYLDGKADSIAIHFHRMFQPNSAGEFKDSLPFLICLNWDEDVYENFDFFEKGFSKSKKDTAVACSYTIDSVTIYNAFMDRYKANGNKSDSVLTFMSDSTFSNAVKTAGAGKVLSFATFEDRKKITKQHFDRNVTDRMAPVIVSARVDNFSDQLNRLTVTLSEPVKMIDEANKTAPFTFYLNSATEVGEAGRFTSSTANAAPGGLGSEKLTLVFDKTNPQKPTPRLGDFVRFRADSWMWSDTANTASEDVTRAASDADMHWNSPTDYNSSKRLPSSWVTIVGDYSVEVSAVKLATMNKDIDAKNTPAVEVFTIPTTMGKEEVMALYPNTLGFIVKSDMASFMSKDSVTEKFFNDHPDELKNVYFQYEVQYYTNLGSYVAGDKSKIYCVDEINKQKYGKEYFGGKDCRSVQGNFYIAWNMLSDKKRLVGTGAYIAKLTSFVKLGQLGKAKSSKASETDMWGAKRGKGIVK